MKQLIAFIRRRFEPVRELWLRLWRPTAIAPSQETRSRVDVDLISSEKPLFPEVVETPKRRRLRADDCETPVWNFRTTILDRLDEYFSCMRRLKRHDPHSYKLFSRMGFAIPADKFFNPDHKSVTEKLKTRGASLPSFGGVLCGGFNEDSDDVHPSFIYWHKMNSPSRVQAFHGQVFRVTVLWDDRDPDRHFASSLSALQEYHIGLTDQGQLVVLRERVLLESRVEARRGRTRRKETITLRSTQWAIPSGVMSLAEETDKDPIQLAAGIFVMAILTYDDSVSKFVIRAKRGGLVASFGIELPRAKRFFADRDSSIVATDGKRKRIFHSVVEHDRQVAEDKSVRVRAHYRGLRTFEWNGNEIHIVLPNVAGVLGFDQPAFDEEDVPPQDLTGMIFEGELGQKLADVLEQ